MCEIAEVYLSSNIKNVVFTVLAYFNDSQRQGIFDSFQSLRWPPPFHLFHPMQDIFEQAPQMGRRTAFKSVIKTELTTDDINGDGLGNLGPTYICTKTCIFYLNSHSSVW